jgi:TusA-related sulfurtransferase
LFAADRKWFCKIKILHTIIQRGYKMTEDSNDQNINPDASLDCIGLYCPIPIARTREEIDKLEVGQVLEVEADDPAAEEDIKRWAKHTEHEILSFKKEGKILHFMIKKTN